MRETMWTGHPFKGPTWEKRCELDIPGSLSDYYYYHVDGNPFIIIIMQSFYSIIILSLFPKDLHERNNVNWTSLECSVFTIMFMILMITMIIIMMMMMQRDSWLEGRRSILPIFSFRERGMGCLRGAECKYEKISS